jgi:hypothetical protein
VDAISHQSLTQLECKFYKIVQNSSKGSHKLITYYDSWNILAKVLNTKFNWQGMDKQTWQRHFTLKPVSRSRTSQSSNQSCHPKQKKQVKDGKVSTSRNKAHPAPANGSRVTDKEASQVQKKLISQPRKGGTD